MNLIENIFPETNTKHRPVIRHTKSKPLKIRNRQNRLAIAAEAKAKQDALPSQSLQKKKSASITKQCNKLTESKKKPLQKALTRSDCCGQAALGKFSLFTGIFTFEYERELKMH